LSPLRSAVTDLLLHPPPAFLSFLNLESVITCSVTEQSVAEHTARVTSAWKTTDTCGARVVVCRSNDILARALGNMTSVLFDKEGVPHKTQMSHMYPFDDDASTTGSFHDRLVLDLLPYMSETGVIYDSCHTILNHLSRRGCTSRI
jgi:hypothetical protein